MKQFEDSLAWQKGKELTVKIYKAFDACRDYSFVDQIRRAAVSAPNNVAEGFERNTDKELKYFLFVAKGSSGEVRSMLLIAFELGYIDQAQFDELNSLCLDVSRLLAGFIKGL